MVARAKTELHQQIIAILGQGDGSLEREMVKAMSKVQATGKTQIHNLFIEW